VPNRILIIKPSALGDIVLALPALTSLRKSFPEAHITWFVRLEFAPLLSCASHLDDIIIFDRIYLGKWFYNHRAFMALMRLASQLRRKQFDLVIDLQGLLRSALFAWFTGCNKRFGMMTAREFATVFYTHKIPQDTDSIHVIDYYNKIISAAGATTAIYDYGLRPTPHATENIKSLLARNGVSNNEYIVLVPCATHLFKQWPAYNFAALADKIASRFSLPIIAVGTEQEKRIIEKMKSLANVPILNFAGLTNLPQLIALLDGAELVVSNDTGPGHIAAAMGVPLVLIYGQTNPRRTKPYKRADAFVAIEAYDRGDKIISSDQKHSIQAVTIDQVFQKVACQLKQTTGTSKYSLKSMLFQTQKALDGIT
jgi:lipopolysaccharide heptosyltransferase I